MALRLTSTVTTSEERHRPRLLPLFATTALTVAAVAGIGAWQLQSGHQTGATRSESQSATENAGLGSAPASQSVTTDGNTGGSSVQEESPASYLYLVASDEQAAEIRRFSAEVSALGVQVGRQPVSVGVLNIERMDPGFVAQFTNLPGLRVFDLRTP